MPRTERIAGRDGEERDVTLHRGETRTYTRRPELAAVERARCDQRNARLLAEIARDAGEPIPNTDRNAKPSPGELRGIPVLARGVGGTSPGTRPDAITDRDEP